MILFGLFHGLIFIPVVLSVVGSRPYPSADSERASIDLSQDSNFNIKGKGHLEVTKDDLEAANKAGESQPLNVDFSNICQSKESDLWSSDILARILKKKSLEKRKNLSLSFKIINKNQIGGTK